MKHINKPFLLIQSRPEISTLDNEYEAFCRYGRLTPDKLIRVHMERDVIPYDMLDDYSGVFMGGGPANFAYDESEKSFDQKEYEQKLSRLMKIIIRQDIPFFGACLGMGAIVLGLDGRMSFEYGESLGATEVKLTSEGKNDPLLLDMPDTFLAIVGHKEGVQVLPSHVNVLAENDHCIQMIRLGQNVYATQFHPELDEIGLRVRMDAYRHNGYFDPQAFEEVIEHTMAGNPTDSQVILQRFVERYK